MKWSVVEMAEWVIESTIRHPKADDPDSRFYGRTITSYWYGLDHGWGKTYGPLMSWSGEDQVDGSVARFPTRKAAETAYRKVKPLRARRTDGTGDRAVRLSELIGGE